MESTEGVADMIQPYLMEITEGVADMWKKADMIQPYLMESTEGVADMWKKARLPKAVGSDHSPRLLGFPPRES